MRSYIQKIAEAVAIRSAEKVVLEAVKEALPSMVADAFYRLALERPNAKLTKVGFANVVGAAMRERHGWDFLEAKRCFCEWINMAGIKHGDPDYSWRAKDAIDLANQVHEDMTTL